MVLGGYDASLSVGGVSTEYGGILGPQGFWLLELDEIDDYVLFIGMSVPFSLLLWNNYANAKWLPMSPAIRALLAPGSNAGGDDILGDNFVERNGDVSVLEKYRLKATSSICGTWTMRNGASGNMTVSIWNY